MPLDMPLPALPDAAAEPEPEDRGREEREVLRRLCDLAEHAGIAIRIEPFELSLAGKGGLCRIEGRPVVLVDARLGVVEQVGIVGQALGAVGLGKSAPPELAPYLRSGHAAVRTLVRPKPLARSRVRPIRVR